jgi:hypothetical protein
MTLAGEGRAGTSHAAPYLLAEPIPGEEAR